MIGSSGEIPAAARSSVSFEGALSAGIEPGIFCCCRNGGRTRVRRYVCDGSAEVRLLVPFQCVAVALQRETNLAQLCENSPTNEFAGVGGVQCRRFGERRRDAGWHLDADEFWESRTCFAQKEELQSIKPIILQNGPEVK